MKASATLCNRICKSSSSLLWNPINHHKGAYKNDVCKGGGIQKTLHRNISNLIVKTVIGGHRQRGEKSRTVRSCTKTIIYSQTNIQYIQPLKYNIYNIVAYVIQNMYRMEKLSFTQIYKHHAFKSCSRSSLVNVNTVHCSVVNNTEDQSEVKIYK